VNYSAV